MMGWQWHQLDHMQIICTSLQTNNHSIFTDRMLFLPHTHHSMSPINLLHHFYSLSHCQKNSKCEKKLIKKLIEINLKLQLRLKK